MGFIIGLLIGTTASTMVLGLATSSSKQSQCEECKLRKLYESKQQQEQRKPRVHGSIADCEELFYDADFALPSHEPIRKKHKRPPYKRYK
jgi:hypothetical protein